MKITINGADKLGAEDKWEEKVNSNGFEKGETLSEECKHKAIKEAIEKCGTGYGDIVWKCLECKQDVNLREFYLKNKEQFLEEWEEFDLREAIEDYETEYFDVIQEVLNHRYDEEGWKFENGKWFRKRSVRG